MTADLATGTDTSALAVVSNYLEARDPRYLSEGVTLDVVPASVRTGRAAVAALAHDVLHGLFTHTEYAVTNLRAAGDQVVAEISFTGRPAPRRWSTPMRGRRITVRAAGFFVVAGGEISEARIYFDSRALRGTAQREEQGD